MGMIDVYVLTALVFDMGTGDVYDLDEGVLCDEVLGIFSSLKQAQDALETIVPNVAWHDIFWSKYHFCYETEPKYGEHIKWSKVKIRGNEVADFHIRCFPLNQLHPIFVDQTILIDSKGTSDR